mmetsp:Transcript_10611/g.14161  ORF Transcript_10611/g.14161 Transcript_10611/m.14161 type:complete len:83 (-) Transcript_10611:109-357(-)
MHSVPGTCTSVIAKRLTLLLKLRLLQPAPMATALYPWGNMPWRGMERGEAAFTRGPPDQTQQRLRGPCLNAQAANACKALCA